MDLLKLFMEVLLVLFWMRLWVLLRICRLVCVFLFFFLPIPFATIFLRDVWILLTTYIAKGALTASLTVRFKAPLYTPQVVLVRGKVAKKDGKKLFLKGSFEDKDGKIFAEADGVWIIVQREVGRWTDGGPTKPQAKL